MDLQNEPNEPIKESKQEDYTFNEKVCLALSCDNYFTDNFFYFCKKHRTCQKCNSTFNISYVDDENAPRVQFTRCLKCLDGWETDIKII